MIEQVVIKSQIQAQTEPSQQVGRSVKSDFGGVSQLSSSTDPFNRSFEDDRRRLADGIQSILLSKIEAIDKTIPGVNLKAPIIQLRQWRTDQFRIAQKKRSSGQRLTTQKEVLSQSHYNTQMNPINQLNSDSFNSGLLPSKSIKDRGNQNVFQNSRGSFYSNKMSDIGFFGGQRPSATNKDDVADNNSSLVNQIKQHSFVNSASSLSGHQKEEVSLDDKVPSFAGANQQQQLVQQDSVAMISGGG